PSRRFVHLAQAPLALITDGDHLVPPRFVAESLFESLNDFLMSHLGAAGRVKGRKPFVPAFPRRLLDPVLANLPSHLLASLLFPPNSRRLFLGIAGVLRVRASQVV